MIQKVYIGDQSIAKLYQGDTLLSTFEDQKEIDLNAIPYVSIYYIKPVVDLNEEVMIDYYVTDYLQKEYKENNFSERFTVKYWIDNIQHVITGVSAGDHTIHLGKLAEGTKYISLQAVDSKGRKSHRLFYEFRVINKAQYQEDIENKTYSMREADLLTYGISINNTKPIETTVGLNRLISWTTAQKYKKLILLKGTYAIDENSSVLLESLDNFTLDLNGATFKLNPNGLYKTMMMRMLGCYDCHVINGTFMGDMDTHDYSSAENNSEWVNGITIDGGKYNSFEELIVNNVTGYGSCTAYNTKAARTVAYPSEWIQGDIENGIFRASDHRYSSSDYIALTSDKYDFISLGYLRIGAYLGYQGNVTGNWVYKASFYDANKSYIEDIEGYAYRRLYFPSNAMYVKITLFSPNKPTTNITVFDIETPVNCAFKKVYHKDVRCVGMALTGFINFLVEGCTFDHCGWDAAQCAFDAEDGWDLMQDLTFRENKFMNNTQNNFLTCAGHNIVAENNEAIGSYIWERTRSYVIRDNKVTLKSDYKYQDITRTGYVRIYRNQNYVTVYPTTCSPECILVIKDDIYYHTTPYGKNSNIDKGAKIKLVNCKFEYDPNKPVSGCGQFTEFINCTYNNYNAYLSDRSTWIGCTFNNSNGLVLHSNGLKTLKQCRFINSLLRGSFNVAIENCTFINTQLDITNWDKTDSSTRIINCDIEISTKDFLKICSSVPVILSHCICTNNSSYKTIYITKSGKIINLTLEHSTFIQSMGTIISGVNITAGAYTIVASSNTISGNAVMLVEHYNTNPYLSLIINEN